MRTIRLQEIGDLPSGTIASLRDGLMQAIGGEIRVEARRLDPAFAFHPERLQYHSTEILARLDQAPVAAAPERILGVTAVDLYIPILTFVFGEAQVAGRCALVSMKRLDQGFYGLPLDAGLLQDRLLKESVHEIGHTLGLKHCDDRTCAMASSNAVEWIDLKLPSFCTLCRAAMGREDAGCASRGRDGPGAGLPVPGSARGGIGRP